MGSTPTTWVWSEYLVKKLGSRLWSFVAGGDNAGREGIEQLRLRDTGEEARGAFGAERRSRGGMGTAMVL
ncbi:hypothetical protein M0R45_036442 [Rubus argutus]|uniref:Uncharacterized protein n=1 Tax=Rubus argutus TaxID=59490 RepID=A0AAW1VYW1_RUBAR